MKKLIALLLVLMLVLSLAAVAGCSKNEEKPAEDAGDTPATDAPAENTGDIDLENSKPCEYIKEKLAAGMEVNVAFSALNDNFFVATQLGDGVKAAVEAEGMKYTYYAANSENMADQITQIENLTTQGVAAIVIQTGDPTGMEDQCLAAQEAGTLIIIYGVPVQFDCIQTMTDTAEVGRQIALMGSAWIDQYKPDAGDGEVKVCVLGGQANPPVIQLSEGILNGVKEDTRMYQAFYNNDCTEPEESYNAAQDAMMVDPDICIFLCYQMSAGLGVNNYLLAQAGLNMWDYAIFGSSDDDTTADLLAAAANGEGAFRGTIQAGANPSATLCEVTLKALYGEISAPYATLDPMRAWVSDDMDYHFSQFEGE